MSVVDLSCDWSWVDDVYLITTTVSQSRLDRTKQELMKVGLWERVQVRTFQPDDEDRVRGCYTSHIQVLEEVQKKYTNREDYRVLVLEDNLELTLRMNPSVVSAVGEFTRREQSWDVFHLAYMMYVPGLSFVKLPNERNVVQMLSDPSSSVGTSAYAVSKSGVDAILLNHKRTGYVEAIPNVMARLFPSSRYAAYPMVFHRAAKVGSLVNPQLDDFRRIMFSPFMYTAWERLMISTGLQNNQLFPTLAISLFIATSAGIYAAVTGSSEGGVPAGLLLAFPLLVAIWGATLFTPGATGAGFAKKRVTSS